MPLDSTNSSSLVGLIQRYLRKLSTWARFRVGRYGLALGLLAAGALLLAAALGIGTAAAFHLIELRYGIWTAYGVVGGTFAGLAAITLIVGLIILNARPPAMPAPPSPARLLRHAVAPIALRLASTVEGRHVPPVNQRTGLIAVGAAALLLAGWISSRRNHP